MSAAIPPPLPPPFAPAQAIPSPSYHSFGARQPPRCTPLTCLVGTHKPLPPLTIPGTPPQKKCKSFVPFTSNFPLMHTPRRLTNLAPQGHFDKFFFFSSFSFSSQTGAGQWRSQHHCHLLPSCAQRPPLLAHHHITHGTQANLPPHSPITHATH